MVGEFVECGVISAGGFPFVLIAADMKLVYFHIKISYTTKLFSDSSDSEFRFSFYLVFSNENMVSKRKKLCVKV